MSPSRPPAKIVDRDFDDETLLYNIDQNAATRKSNPEVDAIYSRPSKNAFIVDLEQEGQLQVNGRASAFRISNDPDYSDDPLTALAEYAARLLAHVNANQGVGWRIENDYTGREIPCIIENVEIIRRRAAKYEFQYAITVRTGDGMMTPWSLDPELADPSGGARLAGEDLHEIEEMMISKRQRLRTHPYATPRPVEANEIQALSGAERNITIRGNVPGDESVRASFDESIRSKIGVNETVDFESPFPGETLEVVVINHDATREAGQTQIGQYNIETVEGTTGA